MYNEALELEPDYSKAEDLKLQLVQEMEERSVIPPKKRQRIDEYQPFTFLKC